MSTTKIDLSIPGLTIENEKGTRADDTASYLITKKGSTEKLSPRHPSSIIPPKKKIKKTLSVYYDTLSKSYSPELAALVTIWKGVDFVDMLNKKTPPKKSHFEKISEGINNLLKIKKTIQFTLRRFISALPGDSLDDLATATMSEIGATPEDQEWAIKRTSDASEELFFQLIAEQGFGNKKQLLEIVGKIVHLRDNKGRAKPLIQLAEQPIKERLTSTEATTFIQLANRLQKVYRKMRKKDGGFGRKGVEAPPHKNLFETALNFEDASEAKTFEPTPPVTRKDRKTSILPDSSRRNIIPRFETPKKRVRHRAHVIIEDTSPTSSPQTPVAMNKNLHTIVIGVAEHKHVRSTPTVTKKNLGGKDIHSLQLDLKKLTLESSKPLHRPGVIVDVDSEPTSEE